MSERFPERRGDPLYRARNYIARRSGATDDAEERRRRRAIERAPIAVTDAPISLVTLGPFFLADVSATLTVGMGMPFFSAGAIFTPFESMYMPREGMVMGGMLVSDATRAAGSMTLYAAKNAVAETGTPFAIIDATNTNRHSIYTASGIAFVAGDYIGASLATSGWSPTTADATAWLVVRWGK